MLAELVDVEDEDDVDPEELDAPVVEVVPVVDVWVVEPFVVFEDGVRAPEK